MNGGRDYVGDCQHKSLYVVLLIFLSIWPCTCDIMCDVCLPACKVYHTVVQSVFVYYFESGERVWPLKVSPSHGIR